MISVVIPVYNQSHFTQTCLQTLQNHSAVAREVIVVDNCSFDDTPEVLKKWVSILSANGWKMQVIRNSENRGFGRACNQGIKAATGDYITILNNDTWLMPRWDEILLKRQKEL